MVGSGTNFNKGLLQDAWTLLDSIPGTLEASMSMTKMPEASDISADIGAMDDAKEGWTWLNGQVSDVATMVAQYVKDLQTHATHVQASMQASIGTLTAADDHSKSTVNKSDGTLGKG